jgi:hypothetical protein
MERGPHILYSSTSLQRGYKIFRTLGLRHLFIIDHSNHLVGMITRTELLPEHISRYEERSYGSGAVTPRNSPTSKRSVTKTLELMERGSGVEGAVGGRGGGVNLELDIGGRGGRGRGVGESDESSSTSGGSGDGIPHVDHLRRRVSMDGLLLADDTYF